MTSPRQIIEKALNEGRTKLLEHEALDLVAAYGVPVPGYGLAKTAEEAAKIAEKIGFPVVLKIVSPDIVHKSDVGGVIVGVETVEDTVKAFNQIIENVKKHVPDARIEGVLVQKMAPKGAVEVVVGAVRDPVFGPAVMFGLGGVFIEVFRDVSFRVTPFKEQDAYEMIQEVKAYKIIRGYRNIAPRDIDSLVNIIMAVQRIMEENPEISEMDLNPILSYEKGKGALAVDVRIILRK
ncbi:acetate--CoA ligase family protein [Pyrofollis japonicus]|uniref:acetate--CoA ligase family protein n=1 Tax=Pyrofollis japonicus TaxID=3060460 RepID=UPI00295AEB4E|nr:acetate--CoA ligase family protein [Pyrofollis japonicus]BEP18206.1 acetate--CoA ligase family protein [Pyrofollis japonicus]